VKETSEHHEERVRVVDSSSSSSSSYLSSCALDFLNLRASLDLVVKRDMSRPYCRTIGATLPCECYFCRQWLHLDRPKLQWMVWCCRMDEQYIKQITNLQNVKRSPRALWSQLTNSMAYPMKLFSTVISISCTKLIPSLYGCWSMGAYSFPFLVWSSVWAQNQSVCTRRVMFWLAVLPV